MSVRVLRFWAIVFIVLSVSPFTAPFSTCDLTRTHTTDEGAMGAVVAAKVVADDSVAILATFSPLLHCALLLAAPPVLVVNEASWYRTAPTILRL
jgi:hypothetical protein